MLYNQIQTTMLEHSSSVFNHPQLDLLSIITMISLEGPKALGMTAAAHGEVTRGVSSNSSSRTGVSGTTHKLPPALLPGPQLLQAPGALSITEPVAVEAPPVLCQEDLVAGLPAARHPPVSARVLRVAVLLGLNHDLRAWRYLPPLSALTSSRTIHSFIVSL